MVGDRDVKLQNEALEKILDCNRELLQQLKFMKLVIVEQAASISALKREVVDIKSFIQNLRYEDDPNPTYNESKDRLHLATIHESGHSDSPSELDRAMDEENETTDVFNGHPPSPISVCSGQSSSYESQMSIDAPPFPVSVTSSMLDTSEQTTQKSPKDSTGSYSEMTSCTRNTLRYVVQKGVLPNISAARRRSGDLTLDQASNTFLPKLATSSDFSCVIDSEASQSQI